LPLRTWDCLPLPKCLLTTFPQHACSTTSQQPAHNHNNLLTTCLLTAMLPLHTQLAYLYPNACSTTSQQPAHNHNNLLTTCLLTAMLPLHTQLAYLYPNACSQPSHNMPAQQHHNLMSQSQQLAHNMPSHSHVAPAHTACLPLPKCLLTNAYRHAFW